jgi:hypothetical protein
MMLVLNVSEVQVVAVLLIQPPEHPLSTIKPHHMPEARVTSCCVALCLVACCRRDRGYDRDRDYDRRERQVPKQAKQLLSSRQQLSLLGS